MVYDRYFGLNMLFPWENDEQKLGPKKFPLHLFWHFENSGP